MLWLFCPRVPELLIEALLAAAFGYATLMIPVARCPFLPHRLSGRSAAWLARLLREQEAGGSNPLAPTISNLPVPCLAHLCFRPRFIR